MDSKAVLSAAQLRAVDKATIDQRGISSLLLMESAATACYYALYGELQKRGNVDERVTPSSSDLAELDDFELEEELNQPFVHRSPVLILCGSGNNGGDGWVIARLLHGANFAVTVLDFAVEDSRSEDNRANFSRATAAGVNIVSAAPDQPLPTLAPNTVLIDALFGTGLNRPLTDAWRSLIDNINSSAVTVWSVDVPSGLFVDKPAGAAAIRAETTFSLGYPKLAEYLPEAASFYGEIVRINFSLVSPGESGLVPYATLYDKSNVKSTRKRRNKYDHKGTFGHALLVVGAHGTMGAAVLAARTAMRAGLGLLTCHVPACGYQIMQISVPEAMCITDEAERYVSDVKNIARYTTVGVGPGIGQDDDTAEALRDLLYRAEKPMVIDADALNILGKHPDWWASVPAGSILTPHPKEFDRLFGPHESTAARWQTQREQAERQGWVIVLKGGHTTVACPDGLFTINTTGNPGMATAGAGDVLTGLLTGLVAQGYAPAEAARYGVCLHGMAGDDATFIRNQEGIVASDIVNNVGIMLLAND